MQLGPSSASPCSRAIRRDLGLHRGGRLAALDHAAARDDDRRDAGRGRGLGDRRGTQRVERHDRDVGPLRERLERRVAGLAVQLVRTSG